VFKLSPDGRQNTNIVTAKTTVQYFALDVNGNIYITDSTYNRVIKYGPDGALLTMFANTDAPEPFYKPTGIAIDINGNMFVKDSPPSPFVPRVVKLDPSGKQIAEYTTPDIPLSGGPSGLALSPSGPLYVADSWNGRIVEFVLSPPSPSTNSGISTGAIVGIVVGVVIAFIALLLVAIVWIRYRALSAKSTAQQSVSVQESEQPAQESEVAKLPAFNPSDTHPAFL